MSAALLHLPYLPDIHWFACFLAYETIYIEQEENFVKSTTRNRCHIAGAGGKLPLTIPLSGGRDHHQLYKQTKISYAKPWQHNHWQSMLSAYGSAPFFSFYAPRFQPFYEKGYELLFSFNLQLLNTVLTTLKINKSYRLTTAYQKHPTGITDLRAIRPAPQNDDITLPRYYQVFEDRNGFIPNLSIADLLFHEGPAAKAYLEICRDRIVGV